MSEPSPAVVAALERWRDNLADLSPRNPLLNLQPRQNDTVAFSRPGPEAIFEWLEGGKRWSIRQGHGDGEAEDGELVCADGDANGPWQALTTLHRQALAEDLDSGLHLLHLAGGLLEWRDDEGESYRSPLVLLPVALARPSLQGPFDLAAVGRPAINSALETRLLRDFAFRLPELGPGDKLSAAYLAAVQAAIAGLPGWRVESAAVLANFRPFPGDAWRELESAAPVLAAHPLVRAIAREKGVELAAAVDVPDEPDLDAVQPPEQAFHVLDADACQRRCLEAAARGQSFVLLGPPGTGKSQTIANLLADCLARGRTALFVSSKRPALEVVLRRLEEVGLGEFCLGWFDAKTNVLAELRRCRAQAPSVEAPPALAERLRECRQRLDAYVEALHRPREPWQRSAWWALGELARCHDLPAIGLHLTDGIEVTAAWLEEGQQALRRAAQLWHACQDPGFPWRGFKLERYNKQLRDEVAGLVEKAQARLERLNAVAREYGKQVEADGPVSWLVRLADLLETSPKPAASWLTAADPQTPLRDVERCAAEYGQQTHEHGPLEERYGAGILHLAEGTAAQLAETWQQVQPLLARGDERGAGFLKHQQQLRGWVADTLRRLPGWLTEGRAVEKWLGLALPAGATARPGTDKLDPSVATLRRLLRLANLCQSDTPPERAWLVDASALAQTQALVSRVTPIFTAFRQGKAALLERYTPGFLELDLERLASAYAGRYRSWMRVLFAQFRRDRRAVRRRTRAGVVPATVADDVAVARDLMRTQRRLEAEGAERRPLLGRYERGLDTDLEAAERAMRVAAEATELAHQLGPGTVPDRLADALAGKGTGADKGRAAARRLQDSLAAWLQHTQELRGVLPLDLLPETEEPLEEATLSALQRHAQALQGPLNRFAALADPILGRAKVVPADVATLLADVTAAQRQDSRQGTTAEGAAPWRERLGPAFQEAATDWGALRRAAGWAQRLRALFAERPASANGSQAVPARVVQLVTGQVPAPSSRELRAAREQLEHALHSLQIRFEPPALPWAGKGAPELSLTELQRGLHTLRSRVEDLGSWADWRTLQRRFDHLGLSSFWQELQTAAIPAERLADLLLKAVLGNWLETVLKDEPALGSFQRAEHERLLDDFQELDRQAIRHAAGAVAARAAARRPSASEASARLDAADVVPHDLLLRIKPCVLMHPLLVRKLLGPGQNAFDLVVFDEASLIPTEEAISALGRGQQVIVCGDDRQLPPAAGRGDEERAPGGADSFLHAAVQAGLPTYSLRCHYRSRKEGLIAFANRHVYSGRLATFPAAAGEPGVTLHHVADGVLAHGVNQREVQVVADLVLDQLRAHGGARSLGVVTFSQAQASAVTEELDGRLAGERGLESLLKDDAGEHFFIKPAQVVQGDERDVIILTVGFARDGQGRLPPSFGPLSRQEGDNVLNVAVTRARESLVVVSSLQASELAPPAASSPGVALLRDFLAYAENGPEAPPGEEVPALLADVAAATRRLGYEVVANLGRGTFRLDLVVFAPSVPNRFLLGILCDGPGYAETPTVRDRDRLRPDALALRGWRLHRIWAPAWVAQREQERDRLRQALEAVSADGPAARLPAEGPQLQGLPGARINQGVSQPEV
jgi:hypothetical protein